jgi:phosphoenolpyruvate synthase/pyruvate phosphate dikinase
VDQLQPGEILVCETTNPSWVTLFLVAEAMVIDIGGVISTGRSRHMSWVSRA